MLTRAALLLLLATSLTACSTAAGLGAWPTATGPLRGDAADLLGGLSSSEAAHASVESAAPAAFALTPAAQPFLAAVERVVRPMRQALASQLVADQTVSRGLAGWSTRSSAQRLAVLKQAATIEGSVMKCQVPPVVLSADSPPSPGIMAFYQPGSGTDIGQVTIYGPAIAKGDPYLALATVVHEMRHAAQFQLVSADEAGSLAASSDEHALAQGYAGAWQTMDALGGEGGLAYGDYVHLNVEFDAFESGNEVAALVGGSAFDPSGSGFVDVQYSNADQPVVDLNALFNQYVLAAAGVSAADAGTSQLTLAVNQAEYAAEHARQQVVPQRHSVPTTFPGGFPRRGGRAGRGGF